MACRLGRRSFEAPWRSSAASSRRSRSARIRSARSIRRAYAFVLKSSSLAVKAEAKTHGLDAWRRAGRRRRRRAWNGRRRSGRTTPPRTSISCPSRSPSSADVVRPASRDSPRRPSSIRPRRSSERRSPRTTPIRGRPSAARWPRSRPRRRPRSSRFPPRSQRAETWLARDRESSSASRQGLRAGSARRARDAASGRRRDGRAPPCSAGFCTRRTSPRSSSTRRRSTEVPEGQSRLLLDTIDVKDPAVVDLLSGASYQTGPAVVPGEKAKALRLLLADHPMAAVWERASREPARARPQRRRRRRRNDARADGRRDHREKPPGPEVPGRPPPAMDRQGARRYPLQARPRRGIDRRRRSRAPTSGGAARSSNGSRPATTSTGIASRGSGFRSCP